MGLSAAFAADFSSDFSPFSFTARAKKGSDFDVSYMNKPVDESQRVMIGQDGHLYSNGKRIRIFGTNLSAFPQDIAVETQKSTKHLMMSIKSTGKC